MNVYPETIGRFFAKVDKNGPFPKDRRLGRCWIWTASKRNKGYGAFAYKTTDGKQVNDRAHRFSFVLHGGVLTPEKPCTLHKCDTPPCCNPTHAFAGSKADNNKDMHRKGRHVPGGTYCGEFGKWLRGTDHHAAKLTPAKVRRLRKKRSEGVSWSKLAAMFGVSIKPVREAALGITWAHVA